MFLYIVPLKQGLKLRYISIFPLFEPAFLYIVPLKQGLKQYYDKTKSSTIHTVFIHSSIKTRIETLIFHHITTCTRKGFYT